MQKEFELDGVEYLVKSPGTKATQEAKRRYSSEFFRCIDEGILTKAQAKERLVKCGVWTDEEDEKEKKIVNEINEIELDLYRGNKSSKRMSIQEGKEKALKIKKLRGEYLDLVSERQSYESNTAESIADNLRFDFLVSECTFKKDGTKVYNSYEDYQDRAEEPLAYTAASTLAQMIYSLEDDFAKKLPENQFLSMFGLVDEELRLINKDGKLVDSDGRLISEEGFYLNEEGNRVDKDGNRLTEDGLFDIDVVYVDEEGNEIEPKRKTKEEEIPAEVAVSTEGSETEEENHG